MLLKRLAARYPCRIPVRITAVPSMTKSTGRLDDIGMSGARLVTDAKLKVELRLEFKLGAKPYTLDGYVVRRMTSEGQTTYGIEFHTYDHKALRALVSELSRKARAERKSRSSIRMRRA